MEILDTLVFFRGLERILASVAGIVALVLAALLYRWGVSGEASLSLEQDKTKLQLANASPGILFALFGAVLLGWSLFKPLKIQQQELAPVAETAKAVEVSATRTAGLSIEYGDETDALRLFLEEAMGSDPDQTPEEVRAQLRAIKSKARDLYRRTSDF
jgi:hypothetical protein